jgi:hypothetical protein
MADLVREATVQYLLSTSRSAMEITGLGEGKFEGILMKQTILFHTLKIRQGGRMKEVFMDASACPNT